MIDKFDRVRDVAELIWKYLQNSPAQTLRQTAALDGLAGSIVELIYPDHAVWTKWDGRRDRLLTEVIHCWIPMNDLRDALNALPGPELTITDVEQRLKRATSFSTETPREELRQRCLEIYEFEKACGTEFIAIIGAIRDYIESEELRVIDECGARHEEERRNNRMVREQRLLSGADCNWIEFGERLVWFCRRNGRLFRLDLCADKMWGLTRVESFEYDEQGIQVAKYRNRSQAKKAVASFAGSA